MRKTCRGTLFADKARKTLNGICHHLSLSTWFKCMNNHERMYPKMHLVRLLREYVGAWFWRLRILGLSKKDDDNLLEWALVLSLDEKAAGLDFFGRGLNNVEHQPARKPGFFLWFGGGFWASVGWSESGWFREAGNLTILCWGRSRTMYLVAYYGYFNLYEYSYIMDIYIYMIWYSYDISMIFSSSGGSLCSTQAVHQTLQHAAIILAQQERRGIRTGRGHVEIPGVAVLVAWRRPGGWQHRKPIGGILSIYGD